MTGEERARLRQLEGLIGGFCRCLRCCCKPGEGHNHPDAAEYWRLLDGLYPDPDETL